MGFYCVAAECKSHDDKRRNPEKHPWMQSVTWVKLPKDPTTLKRWTKLIRRGGKPNKENIIDNVTFNRGSRICSRHFDAADIDDGHANSDPKHFAWNNWGKPMKPRSTSAMDKRENVFQLPVNPTPQPLPVYDVVTDVVVPEIAVEVSSGINVDKELVGGKAYKYFINSLFNLLYGVSLPIHVDVKHVKCFPRPQGC